MEEICWNYGHRHGARNETGVSFCEQTNCPPEVEKMPAVVQIYLYYDRLWLKIIDPKIGCLSKCLVSDQIFLFLSHAKLSSIHQALPRASTGRGSPCHRNVASSCLCVLGFSQMPISSGWTISASSLCFGGGGSGCNCILFFWESPGTEPSQLVLEFTWAPTCRGPEESWPRGGLWVPQSQPQPSGRRLS